MATPRVTKRPPSLCRRNTSVVRIYFDGNVSRCTGATGFSFLDPPPAASRRRSADEICATEACRNVFRRLLELHVTEECQLQNATYLYRDVMRPLSESSLCTDDKNVLLSFPDESEYELNSEPSEPLQVPSTTPMMSDGDSQSSHLGLLVGVLAGVLALVVVLAFVVGRKCRRRAMDDIAYTDLSDDKPVASTQSTSAANTASQASSLWNDQELLSYHVQPEDIEDLRLIGAGGYGVVYLVRYRQTQYLASKRLAPDKITRAASRALADETKRVAKLNHPCIVEFIGAAWTKESDLQALFEYMPNGDLTSFLANTRPEPPAIPTWNATKLQIAIDIINALVYVHSFSPPLVHRDLKSRNVLLDAGMRAKLSDFGISRYQSETLTMTTGVGTSGWLAPEVILGGGDYDERCDIYSFGIVLVEMDSHQLPFIDLISESGSAIPEMAILRHVVEGKLHPRFQESCPKKLRALALQCVAFDPNQRPSAKEVELTLRSVVRETNGE